jgi:hypothetical protein
MVSPYPLILEIFWQTRYMPSMALNNNKNKRLVGLFFLGGLLLNYPLLSLFNFKKSFYGIPLLYLYIFLIWFVLVFLIGFATRPTAISKIPKAAD